MKMTAERHLTAKRDAELPRFQRGPEARFRFGWTAAMLTSEELEPSLSLEVG